tara:strand:- start:1601 stop:2143 length:543 start_codon:yes stop_codon:yes gene_type:complete
MKLRLLLLVFMASLASRSTAHEQKTAFTDIFINERTGNLELAHRFIIHDAEHSLQKVTQLEQIDLARSPEAQAAFANYAAKRFAVILPNEKPLKLILVGQERERGYLWVYQEARIPAGFEFGFSIKNKILHDVVKGQVNTVNVRFRSQVSTLVFKENTGAKRYRTPSAAATRKKNGASKR